MINLENEIKINMKEIEIQINQLEKKLVKAPKTILRCSTGNNGKFHNYFTRNPGENRSQETYIKKSDILTAKLLAERDYHQELLTLLKSEYDIMHAYLDECSYQKRENVYNQLPDGRKNLVNPIFIPREQYIEDWCSVEYIGKPNDDENNSFRTNRGEIVRSKSEKIIADRLFLRGIPYRYEYPLKLNGYDKEIYADFVVLNKRTMREYIWEHLGRMDAMNYFGSAIWRLDLYEKNGYLIGKKIIISHESSVKPINIDTIDEYINYYLT